MRHSSGVIAPGTVAAAPNNMRPSLLTVIDAPTSTSPESSAHQTLPMAPNTSHETMLGQVRQIEPRPRRSIVDGTIRSGATLRNSSGLAQVFIEALLKSL